MNDEALLDKFAGCLLGLAYGDAIGMPAEDLKPVQVWSRFQWIDGFFDCPRTSQKGGHYTAVTQLSMLQAMTIVTSGLDGPENFAAAMKAAEAASKARWSRWKWGIAENKTGPSHLQDILPARMVPLGLFFAAKPSPDTELLKACKKMAAPNISKAAILGSFAVAWAVKELVRHKESLASLDEIYLADNSMVSRLVGMCRKIEDKIDPEIGNELWRRLDFARKKTDAGAKVEEFAGLNGNGWGHLESVPFSLFCFLRGPDDCKSVFSAANMGGASSLNAALVGALVGAHVGSGYIKETTPTAVEGAARIIEVSKRLLVAAKERSV